MMLAVMMAVAPSLYWGASAGSAVHDGAFAVCVDEAGTGSSDNEVRQHHNHSCAGHVMGVPDFGVRMYAAESRDSNLPAPRLGIFRILSGRFDRPPLIPDLA